MDAETFIAKIKELSSRLKEWRYPSYKVFRSEYSKEFPNYNYDHYLTAFSEFEPKLRNQFERIAKISSRETPRGGSTPMSELMAG